MDEIEKLSWFVEFIAYCGNTKDNPRRQGFEKKLKQYFLENDLEIGKKKTEKKEETG
jgi:hypothetical protein